MPKGYHHLTRDSRCQIYTLLKRGDSVSLISETLKVHRSTVYRELKRNSGLRGYRYKQAHEKAVNRRSYASRQPSKMTKQTIQTLEERLELQWSPEQIAGHLKKRGFLKAVSHETIYKHIWSDKKRGGSLYKHLRHSGKKYNKRSKTTAGRGCIPNRVDIDERPKEVEEKKRLGDWELDTMIGAVHSGVIVSMVERRSKLTKLAIAPRKTATAIKEALLKRLRPIKECVLTLTSDNGKEFASHETIGKELEAGFYFAKPYHSWERGLNEHTNGLVRQYYPKGTRFDELTEEALVQVEELLNHRPRKVLNFLTPMEVFNQLASQSGN